MTALNFWPSSISCLKLAALSHQMFYITLPRTNILINPLLCIKSALIIWSLKVPIYFLFWRYQNDLQNHKFVLFLVHITTSFECFFVFDCTIYLAFYKMHLIWLILNCKLPLIRSVHWMVKIKKSFISKEICEYHIDAIKQILLRRNMYI